MSICRERITRTTGCIQLYVVISTQGEGEPPEGLPDDSQEPAFDDPDGPGWESDEIAPFGDVPAAAIEEIVG